MITTGWQRATLQVQHSRETKPLVLVADGALSIPKVADGRIIPVLILETSEREDVDEYVRIHQAAPPGDVSTQWGRKRFGSKRFLIVRSLRPVEISMIIELDAERNAQLINFILRAEAFYLQPGRPGDRLSDQVSKAKVLIGVPDTGFAAKWRREYASRIVAKFKRMGLRGRAAEEAAAKHIATMSQLEDWVPPRN